MTRRTGRAWSVRVVLTAAGAALLMGYAPGTDAAGEGGRSLLEDMAEANRYWLGGPPAAVGSYAYDYHRQGRDPQRCEVAKPSKAGRAVRQGASYYSLVHRVAAKPGQVEMRTLEVADGFIRMSLGFDPPLKGHCGNGMQGSWYGYFNLGGETGLLVLDAERLTPVSSTIGDVTETFGDFVEIEPGRHVPLSIVIENGDDMRFDWTFAVHEPGLWLLDRSRYQGKDVAWIDGVEVNEAASTVQHRLPANADREVRASAGHRRLDTFLDANRHWLLPSLEARRGLVYAYAQEAPYRERVIFDRDGRIMVELASSGEHPDQPTRQRLWLPDGRRVTTSAGDPFVVADAPPDSEAGLPRDRHVQHLAMGLGLDCALTRLARDPGGCWTEVLEGEDGDADTYTLVVHWTKDARLFAGTMLMFTSWAYMHDIGYQRSEILCDAATHLPIQEKDFAGDDLVGQFFFEGYLDTPSGPAPGCIRAIVPHEEDGQDHALDTVADFGLVEDDLWLLRRVRSAFRGGGGSTGRVHAVNVEAGDGFAPVRGLVDRLARTEQVLASIREAPEGRIELVLPVDGEVPAAFRPAWSEGALEAAHARRDDVAGSVPLIGTTRARLLPGEGGAARLVIDGIARCDWKEYRTQWAASLTDRDGHRHTGTAEARLRSEGGPAAFTVEIDLPAAALYEDGTVTALVLEGQVVSMSGAYHGHGLWFTFAE